MLKLLRVPCAFGFLLWGTKSFACKTDDLPQIQCQKRENFVRKYRCRTCFSNNCTVDIEVQILMILRLMLPLNVANIAECYGLPTNLVIGLH